MTMKNRTTDFEFGGPARYRIVVQGVLDPAYTDRVAGMVITTTEGEDRSSHTVLKGYVRDQAELSGVLDTLYNLHMPIVEVTKIEDLSDDATEGISANPTNER